MVVNKSDHYRPRYSMALSFRQHNAKVGRFLSVRARGQGSINIDSMAKMIAKVWGEAESYVTLQLQKAEDEYIEEKQRKEARDLERERPKQRPGLKQLAKR